MTSLVHFYNKQNLLGRSARAGTILTVGSLLENGLRFIRNIILARLLAPEAFGLMAVVLASVAVVEAFSEVGLRQSVIQNRNGAEEGFLNITWWISSARGLFLFAIGYLVAPFICDFYGKPESVLIIRTGYLAILFNGFLSPKIHVLEKEMRFRNWVFLMQGSGVLGVIITIISAFIFKNVWALVSGYVAESCIRLLLSFVFFPIKPRLNLNRVFLNDIINFSRRMFGLPILTMIFHQADIFVIGKVMSMGQLGIYSLALNLATMPSSFLLKIINPIVLPVLSSMQDDQNKTKTSLLTLTRCSAIFGIPLVSFLFIFSEPILSIVYGRQYGTAALPFGILCIASLILVSSSFIMNMYIARGQPNIQRSASFARTVFYIIIIYPAVKHFGVTGAAVSILLAMGLLISFQLVQLKKILDISYREYMGSWAEGFAMCPVVVIPGILLISLTSPHVIRDVFIGLLLCLTAWVLGIRKVFYSAKITKNLSVENASVSGDSNSCGHS